MEKLKFGADLLVSEGRIGGHVFLSDNSFEWKPALKFTGTPMVYPIEDIIGYKKEGTRLMLGIKTEAEFVQFYTWKGDSIINGIKERNPYFRMFSSDEIQEQTGKSFWANYWWIIIAILFGIIKICFF